MIVRVLSGLVIGCAVSLAQAQDWPNRPVRIVVPFPPGGVMDVSIRAVAGPLQESLGQSIVIENRAGSAGNVGTEAVARAAPDGYTLLGIGDHTTIVPSLYAKLSYDFLRDFTAVTNLVTGSHVLVAHASLPINNVRELIDAAKRSPGQLSYASPGSGSAQHLGAEILKSMAGNLDIVHIPYKGGGQAIGDVVGGQIPLVYTAVATAQQFVKAGKLKALGVSSAKRSPALPEVQTFIEAGLPGFVVDSWIGLLAPAKTPRGIVDRLRSEILAVLALPEVRDRYAALGLTPVGSTPEEFTAQLRAELARWEPVVKKAGIKAE